MESIKKRLSEPSTYAGLGLLIAGAQQYFVNGADSNAVIASVITGLASVFLGEKSR